MEDVLDVYQRPYNPEFPVVCFDESSKQLIGEVKAPIPMTTNHPKLQDDEYVRNGVAEILLSVEPLAGQRHIEITSTRTRIDWAGYVKEMVDERYANAKKVVLVMDNLNTHSVASLYEAFSPEEAHRIAQRIEIHYAPKHGSWLNIAEIELAALKVGCLERRIPDISTMKKEVDAWTEERNNKFCGVDWHFDVGMARKKLKHIYPAFYKEKDLN